MEPAYLEDRAVLAVTGPEARGFLQGLITNDIEQLTPGRGIYAALLTPQGKITFDFLIAEGEGAILLDCAAGAAEGLLKKLRLYRLRAKVEIELREQLGVYVNLAGHPENRPAEYAARAVTFPDPRNAALGMRSIASRDEMPVRIATAAVYHAHRLALGVPEADDFGRDRMFALDAGLDELHGVSFRKGCYIGQELTARMKHRGTARKRLLLVTAEKLPAPDTPVTANGVSLGEIVSVHGERGFALIRLDRLEETKSAALEAGGDGVILTKQDWL